ncbi:helix-turn-helix transcriptional regulator [Flavobacterium sp.]|uniref:helix-turn-helix domain-containing protein n=1 Tax=Flavobacterium sp. TaxID=239 RepID=UPI00286BC7D0|nr:helix-turn-helix transcriptional regulator [Flavobacterium sp.]
MIENEEINLLKSVGEKLRQKRIELNLSQEILSFDANIPRNQIGRIERGEINTSIITLHKICKALKIEIKELL